MNAGLHLVDVGVVVAVVWGVCGPGLAWAVDASPEPEPAPEPVPEEE